MSHMAGMRARCGVLLVISQSDMWYTFAMSASYRILRWAWRLIHMKYIARMPETIFMCSTKELLVHLSCNSYEVHMKFTWISNHSLFIWTSCISCELFMSLMSTSLVLHGYNILTSSFLRYEVHMKFIRIACKLIWINLISFHIKFMRIFIWTPYEVHMNFSEISYE